MEEFAILFDSGIVLGHINGLVYEYEDVSKDDISTLAATIPLAEDLFQLDNVTESFNEYDYTIIKNINSLVDTLTGIDSERTNVIEFCDCYVIIPPRCKICADCLARRYSEGININYCPVNAVASKIVSINYVSSPLPSIPLNDVRLLEHNQIMVLMKAQGEKFNVENFICYPDCVRFIAPSVKIMPISEKSSTSHRSTIIKNLDDYVGRFCPVVFIENLGSYDGGLYPVYGSMSASSILEKEFSYHGGKGHNQQQAESSAIGEAIERYSARKFWYDEDVISSEYDLAKKSLPFVSIYDLHPFDPKENWNNKQIEWCRGDIVGSQKREFIYIPANVVYFPYEALSDLHFTMQSTTGLASGVSVDDAKLQGLLELIERHYYSLAFRTDDSQSLVSDIELDTDNPLLKNLRENFRFHLTLLNDSRLGCYVVHCVLESKEDNFPKYTHGSGAAMDIITAIYRAIFESLQLRTSQIVLNNSGQIHDEGNIAYLKWGEGKEDEYYRVLLNNDSRNVVHIIDDYSSSKFEVNTKDAISLLCNQLNEMGVQVYSVDLSRKDVPLKCVRMIAPKLQDIDNEFVKITAELRRLGLKNKRVLFS